MANVGFIREDLTRLFPFYDMVDDTITENGVKSKGEKYLPKPDPSDDSEENKKFYKNYLERAVFYYVTKRTLSGLSGELFVNEPKIEFPDILKPVVENVGDGNSIQQLAKMLAEKIIAFGRSGLLIDHPIVDESQPISKADIDSGKIRPSISYYGPKNIINWRSEFRNGKTFLTKVILKEDIVEDVDGYEFKNSHQLRELKITEGVYSQQLWRPKNLTEGETPTKETEYEKYQGEKIPKYANGETIDHIPFSFCGSKNNDPSIDDIPLYDLASLNISHYRNSADYEESIFIVGQPTPYFTGIDDEWYEKILNGRIYFGSRSSIPLPMNATAGILQPEANSMAFEAMQHKENQMVAIGAKIIQKQEVQRTATEIRSTDVAQNSILESVAQNIAECITFAMTECYRFVSINEINEDELSFSLSNNLSVSVLTTVEREKLVSEWQNGAISYSELRSKYKDAGIAFESDEDVLNKFEQTQKKKFEQQQKLIDKKAVPE